MAQSIFSLEGLIGWLAMQPSEKAYVYHTARQCLIFEYLKARGVPVVSVTASYWRDEDREEHWGMTRQLDSVALGGVGRTLTYGAALQRARKLLVEEHDVASQ